ncbi:MAG: class I SAM-dependent methyltransferase [Candidatus Delongbacteria bacterium]|nr:class I SAM-dependent methyltransferase [Candidatus Delongbacteria bacterium]
MTEIYSLKDFIYNEDLKVYIYPEEFNYSYSDGDITEKNIYDILKESPDNSSDSDFLKNKIANWPTEYHFSEYRINLLRHFNFKEKTILELGAGCGALTRFMGEISVKVDAVEGSLARAKCVSERCRELSNVKVYCGNFTKIESNEEYDIVTLIGVAEYAPIYLKTEEPFIDYLKIAKKFLKKDGFLILAIENKLGLKYFSGLPEDHVGVPYFGISNLYDNNSVATYGKKEIIEKLNAAGFYNIEFSYPFPDYKLPKIVVMEPALTEKDFKVSDLLLNVNERDYSKKYKQNFNTGLVWEAIENNNLLDSLSNSFLITAYTHTNTLFESNVLAYYYTLDRKKKYNTITRFIKRENNIVVIKSLVNDLIMEKRCQENGLIIQKLENIPYVRGKLLEKSIAQSILCDNFEQLILNLKKWITYLIDNGIKEKRENIYSSIAKGEYFDCLPFNLIEIENNILVYIDREWVIKQDISLYQIILRYLITIENKCFIKPYNIISRANTNVIQMLKYLDMPVLLHEIQVFEELNRNITFEIFKKNTFFKVLKTKNKRIFSFLLKFKTLYKILLKRT